MSFTVLSVTLTARPSGRARQSSNTDSFWLSAQSYEAGGFGTGTKKVELTVALPILPHHGQTGGDRGQPPRERTNPAGGADKAEEYGEGESAARGKEQAASWCPLAHHGLYI